MTYTDKIASDSNSIFVGSAGFSLSRSHILDVNSLHPGRLNIGLRGTISLCGKPNNRLVLELTVYHKQA